MIKKEDGAEKLPSSFFVSLLVSSILVLDNKIYSEKYTKIHRTEPVLFWEQCQWIFKFLHAKIFAMVSYSISYNASFKLIPLSIIIIAIRRYSMNDTKIDAMFEALQTITKDITDMKKDMSDMKKDMSDMKKDMVNMKEDIRGLKEETQDIRLHIENVTDKNISLLAENYCNLVQKLDENNKVTDSQLAYQIKVNYLISDMDKMKQEMAEIKKRIS